MRDVVIAGGGLSGLVAAYELEKRGLSCSIVEIKRRTGGSIQTVQRGEFVMDGPAFATTDNLDRSWLADIGLDNALIPLETGAHALYGGTQTLIDALNARTYAPRLYRMAVSSVGEMDDHCGVCLENGILLDTRAIVVALPARMLDRLFYSYIDAISESMRDFRYDRIHRLSLGFSETLPPLVMPPDLAYAFVHRLDGPPRAPEGGTLIQVGLRIVADHAEDDGELLEHLCQDLKLPKPDAVYLADWADADPLSSHEPGFAERIRAIRDLLPPRIAIINSDTLTMAGLPPGVVDLGARIEQARHAAEQIAQELQG